MNKIVRGIFGGGGSTPKPPVLPPEAPPPPTIQDVAVTTARADERRRAALTGRGPTILTGAQGLNTVTPSAKKVLLGV